MATSAVEPSENPPPSPPSFTATRNYTSPEEKDDWFYIKRYAQDIKCSTYSNRGWQPREPKEDFRTRRKRYRYCRDTPSKLLRLRIENSNEIGVFMKMTNTYCLTCNTNESADHFINTIRADLLPLEGNLPIIINTSLAGCRVVGSMCVGNNKGLIVPDTIYDTELQHIRKELPDSVKVGKVEERLSALGNVIACNDSVAIIHPDIDKETEEVIRDTLQVEVFRHMIANNPLIGSYCVLSNRGGIVCPDVSNAELENLSSLLQVPLATGTVNAGSKALASGLVVNDRIAYAGMKTTISEFSVIKSVFHSADCSN